MSRITLLALPGVDEHDGEPVPVVDVVAAAGPGPVDGEVGETRPGAAAAGRQLAVTIRTRHGVEYSSRHQRLTKRCFRRPCNTSPPVNSFFLIHDPRFYSERLIFSVRELCYIGTVCHSKSWKQHSSTVSSQR